jgi:hypothetical protein
MRSRFAVATLLVAAFDARQLMAYLGRVRSEPFIVGCGAKVAHDSRNSDRQIWRRTYLLIPNCYS